MSKIVFAGAGTAGHVEPALAVAKWLKAHDQKIEMIFLGTQEGVENRLVPAADFPLALVNKLPFPRRLGVDLILWPFRFLQTLHQVRKVVAGADLVIGFGGYVAAPAYLVARGMGISIIAHEANAKPGMANKLAKFCGATVLRAFGESTPERVGIPLRESIVELSRLSPSERLIAKHHARRGMNLDPNAPTILIFGGSLGSIKFNATIDQARAAIGAAGYQMIHAVGVNNELPQISRGYLPMPYIDDMASAYAAADLVISRSGAVTVAEVSVLGIYGLFIPLPIGNGEQVENARSVVEQGAGEILDNSAFNADWLIAEIDGLMERAKVWSDKELRIEFPLNAAEQIGLRSLKELRHG
jgi:UDP-N-acetylglucosamine--N-acetylmuramyl-(pentapeptide) pyrophosphoryl-undecaprenol N-acetylglucosamine transferase